MKIKRRYIKFLRFLLLLILLIIMVLGIYWIMQPGVKTNVIKIQTPMLNKPVVDMTKYENKLSDWVKAWQKVIPDFNLNTMAKSREGPFKPCREESYRPDTERERLRKQILVFSPDKSKYLDLYEGMGLSEENGVLWAVFDVDTGVALVDLKNKKYIELLFSGPSGGGFDEAFWLDNHTFAIAGAEMRQKKETYVYVPTLAIYNLMNSRAVVYSGPGVSEEIYFNLIRKLIWKNFYRKHPNIRMR